MPRTVQTARAKRVEEEGESSSSSSNPPTKKLCTLSLSQRCTDPTAPQDGYRLLVGGVLVRVGSSDPVPPTPVNEDLLLATLKKAAEKLTPLPKKEKYSRSAKVSVPYTKEFFDRIIAGDQQAFIDFVEKNSILGCLMETPNYVTYDLIHLCAFGGWPQSLKFLQDSKMREHTKTSDNRNTNILRMAAEAGRANVLHLRPTPTPKEQFRAALRSADHHNHAEVQYALAQMYREDKRLETEKTKDYSYYGDNYPLPELEVTIPSLVTICTHVAASEAIYHTSKYASKLLSLPVNVLELVFNAIARNEMNAYRTLDQLKRENPELGRAIPATAWIDSISGAEKRIRQFTFHQFIADKDSELQLIDVFDELDSFVIVPEDEFEQNVTKFLPTEREVGAPSIANKEQFLQQFKTFTSGVFDNFDFSNMVIIGGSVIGSALPIPTKPPQKQQFELELEDDSDKEESTDDKEKDDEVKAEEGDKADNEGGDKKAKEETKEEKQEEKQQKEVKEEEKNEEKKEEKEIKWPVTMDEYYKEVSPFKGSDIDICIYGLSNEEATKKIEAIYHHLKEVTKRDVQILKSTSNIVFVAYYPFRHVQVSLTKFRSLSHILSGVDIDCSALAFDGAKLWASPRARLALNHRWTVVNPDLYNIRGCPQYENRLVKYARRGFAIVDRNFHLYEEEKDEPSITDDEYGVDGNQPDLYGAALVSAIIRWPGVRRVMRTVDKRSGVPYGPTVTKTEMAEFLEEIAEFSNTGYGPADTVLQEAEEDCFCEIDIARESTFEVEEWYSILTEKSLTDEAQE